MAIVGETQSGKTRYGNELHREFPAFAEHQGRRVPRISIFVDTKGIDNIWGARIRSLNPLGKVVLHGQKLVYDPPRHGTGIHWEHADAELAAFWGSVQAAAKRSQWTSDRDPWIQLIVDEAQLWQGMYTGLDGKRRRHPDTLDDMAARGLGMGLRLVIITQYPAGLSTETRNNLTTRIVYRLGDEGRRCIRGWGWPEEEITAWTTGTAAAPAPPPHRFASYHPQLGWRYHEARPR